MPKKDLELEKRWRIKFDEYKKSGQSVKCYCYSKIVPHTGKKIGHLNQISCMIMLTAYRTGGKDMIKMAQLEDIRKMYFMEGLSIREINRRFIAISTKKPTWCRWSNTKHLTSWWKRWNGNLGRWSIKIKNLEV